MKKIILILMLLLTSTAFADTCSKGLTGVFTAAQATVLCSRFSTLSVSLIPASDATYNLGSSTKYWQNLYVTKIFGNTTNFRIVGGTTATLFRNSADTTTNLTIVDAGGATFRDSITSSGTGSLGWSYVTGANTACTTTCTSAAVFGVDLAAGASQPVIVSATDATADACICAGAS